MLDTPSPDCYYTQFQPQKVYSHRTEPKISHKGILPCGKYFLDIGPAKYNTNIFETFLSSKPYEKIYRYSKGSVGNNQPKGIKYTSTKSYQTERKEINKKSGTISEIKKEHISLRNEVTDSRFKDLKDTYFPGPAYYFIDKVNKDILPGYTFGTSKRSNEVFKALDIDVPCSSSYKPKVNISDRTHPSSSYNVRTRRKNKKNKRFVSKKIIERCISQNTPFNLVRPSEGAFRTLFTK